MEALIIFFLETPQSSPIPILTSTADSTTGTPIPMSTSTTDSEATTGTIFGIAFGLATLVIVIAVSVLVIILIFLKYRYHKKQATTNKYAHIIIKLHLTEFIIHQVTSYKY